MLAPSVIVLLSGALLTAPAAPSAFRPPLPVRERDASLPPSGLQPPAFRPLPMGSVRPEGWLRRQLEIQAAGLSGQLDKVWPDIRDSRWFGGEGNDSWERAPYWLDGAIPLAWLLDDADLKGRIQGYMDYVLTHQDEDGWIGPPVAPGSERDKYDLWAILLATKVLVKYHDATGDARVEDAVYRCLRNVAEHVETAPLFNWGQFRAFEGLIALQWLQERRPEPWMHTLADTIRKQGFDWAGFFQDWQRKEPTEKGKWNFEGHVVNNAMAVKAPALWWRHSGDGADRDAAALMIAKLEEYHGMVTGVFTGDECLAGRSPIQGTELCAVVEYMWSLEVLGSVLGDPAFGDRLERIAFNALPATFSPDMWSHQYDQQVNQVECSVRENRSWNTNGPDANLFGLEPNFGCCTSNLSQGWPKFAAHLWMATPDGGLAAFAYAPSSVAAELSGVPVRVTLDTDYPFRDTIRFRVETDGEVAFPLLLRIPAWAEGATVSVDEAAAQVCAPGTFLRIERMWGKGTTKVILTLPMAARAERRYRNALSITRGPLVYGLRIGEDWRRVNADVPGRELPHADWEVYATTPWNYALAVNEDNVAEALTFAEHPVGDRPFSPDGAPITATVQARRLPGWALVNGSADVTPESPASSDSPLETVTLIPYGCTNLRVAEFPTLE